jgi:hypothetical protein
VNGGELRLGLFNFGARYLDADIGRWISTDPARQFWDSYRYTTNPISFIDPDGLADKLVAIYYNATLSKSGKNVQRDANAYAKTFQSELRLKFPEDNVQVKAFKAGDIKGIASFLNQGSATDAKNVLLSHSAPGIEFISDIPNTRLVNNPETHKLTFSQLETALDVNVGLAACGAATTLQNVQTENLKPVLGTENAGSNVTQATRDYLKGQ